MTRKRTKMLQNIIECMPISSMRLGPVGVAGSTDCWKVGLLSFACSLAPPLAHQGCCLARSVGGWLWPCPPLPPPPPLRRPQPAAADRCTRRPFSRGPCAASRSPSAPAPPISLSLNENRKLAPLSLHYESDGRTDGRDAGHGANQLRRLLCTYWNCS